MLKTVVEAGLNSSRGGLYSSPARQNMKNLERIFSPQMSAYLKTWENE